jgi:hypothetical protein
MQKEDLLDVLADHADALNRGHDSASHWLARYPVHEAELRILFHLASEIKKALVPVDVPDQFRLRLHHGLLIQPLPLSDDAAGRPNRVWLGVAAVGSLLSLAGLSLLLTRRLRSVTSEGVTHPVAAAGS